MICQRCNASIHLAFESLAFDSLTETAHLAHLRVKSSLDTLHNSLGDLQKSVLEGCWICRRFWHSLLKVCIEYENHLSYDDIASPDFKHAVILECGLLKKLKFGHSPTTIQLTWPEDKLSGPSGRMMLGIKDRSFSKYYNFDCDLRPIADGYTAFKDNSMDKCNPTLWNHWLRTCSASYKTCHILIDTSKSFTPDRLVEITSQDNGVSFQWKVVRRIDVGDVPYLTLSHCWGFSGHTSLTTENSARFLELGEALELPKTFQHAFYVTFSLGFQYIWIDSICIIQDNQQDWEEQASKMGLIYANAHCNMAATWASDGNDGCFPLDGNRLPIISLNRKQPKMYSISPQYIYDYEMKEAPLNNRGWVVQERYLSRRQLAFTKSQVYWECKELAASEHLPMYDPVDPASTLEKKPDLATTNAPGLRKAWFDLVCYYSRCKFSRVSDKMIALAGLVEHIRGTTKDTYIAGLWKKDLIEQLLWKVDSKQSHLRIPIYMGPTWSWMSIEASVVYDVSYCFDYAADQAEPPSSVEILDVAAPSVHASGLHSFEACTLTLRGLALWASFFKKGGTYVGEEGANIYRCDPTHLRDSSEYFDGQLYFFQIEWDEKISEHEVAPEKWQEFLKQRRSVHLFMVITLSGLWGVRGLLLRKQNDMNVQGQYVRAGVFETNQQEFFELMSTKLGLSSGSYKQEDVKLDDPRLADLIHTVIII